MSKKKKMRIDRDDKFRVLLTEILPYETPLRFGAFFFYGRLRVLEKERDEKKLKWTRRLVGQIGKRSSDSYQPYKYTIQRGGGLIRNLHVMHPLGAVRFCDLYGRFGHNIVSLCQKSHWSLRAPIRIARTYYDRSGAGQEQLNVVANMYAEWGVEIASEDPVLSTSYFSYGRFAFLHKFFDSAEFGLLELRFGKYVSIDVSSCFDSIYTHTISWAVKGKPFAKRDRGFKRCFDAEFDASMRGVNHDETAGILIGPEASRIFAEVILQSVDCEAESLLAERGYLFNRDYSVRRYVDDFFIFVNNLEVAAVIVNVIAECLQKVKLRLNKDKTAYFSRPFITNSSRVKQVFSERLDQMLESAASGSGRRSPFTRRGGIIGLVKSAVVESGGTYGDCSKFVLACLRNKLFRNDVSKGDAVRLAIDAEFVQAAFFVFAVSPEYQTGVSVARLLSCLLSLAADVDGESERQVKRIVLEEFNGIVRLMCDSSSPPRFEMASLFVAIEGVFGLGDATIPAAWIERIWFGGDAERLDYFTIVCLLHSLAEVPAYGALHKKLIGIALEAVAVGDLSKAGDYMLALDLISCPHIDPADKLIIAKKVGGWLQNSSIGDVEAKLLIGEASKESWFFDWNRDRSVNYYLAKKSVSSVY